MLLSLLPFFMNAQQLAFPGAEGYGRFATGGRGGQVAFVTNLNDNGEGSFRAALLAYPGEPLTIMFRVSGIIELKSSLDIRRSNLTIAGQTAPGYGICLKGHSLILNGAGKEGNKGNIIIRYIRSRPGGTLAKGLYGFDMENCHDVIIDHCSFSWANEECAAMYDTKNTTMQWCIVSEGLYNAGHAKGSRAYGGVWGGQNASYHHNLIAHQNSRTVRFNGSRAHDTIAVVDFYNNVIYNWGSANASYGGDVKLPNGVSQVNMINNYYLPGPATPKELKFVHALYDASNTTGVGQWYLAGNIMKGSSSLSKNNVNGIDFSEVPVGLQKNAVAAKHFGMGPGAGLQSADAAFQSVTTMAGNDFPSRDEVDARVVKETMNGTASGKGSSGKPGIIDNPEAVGGWPSYGSYLDQQAPTDADNDGMPDQWEQQRGLDPKDASDRNKTDSEGYTMLENYFNNRVERRGERSVAIVVDDISNARLNHGAVKLREALIATGYTVQMLASDKPGPYARKIVVKISGNAGKKEGFTIRNVNQNNLVIEGNDASGALYGCLELAGRVIKNKKLPLQISFTDQPEMVLRGSCIGIQKPVYLPGRHVYEYPYTPETFPWLYDKKLWIQYLD
ncbi:MAG: hypothetical protein WCF67_05155, partial [Chitinophagaceae bacterium]